MRTKTKPNRAVYLAALSRAKAHHNNARYFRRLAAAFLSSDNLTIAIRCRQLRDLARENTILAKEALALARENRKRKEGE